MKIYREENVARETAVAKLTQQYQKISGGMTVEFEGKEQTLARMSRIQEEPDRARREAAWTAVTARRLQDAARAQLVKSWPQVEGGQFPAAHVVEQRGRELRAEDRGHPDDVLGDGAQAVDAGPDKAVEHLRDRVARAVA